MGHPLVAGLRPFEVRDELYICELHPPLEVLLPARFTGECRGFDVQDLGIDDLGRRDFGSWPVAEFRTVLKRCVDWAVTGAFPG